MIRVVLVFTALAALASCGVDGPPERPTASLLEKVDHTVAAKNTRAAGSHSGSAGLSA